MDAAPDDEVAVAAEKLVRRWDSSSSSGDPDARDRMLFDGSDRSEAQRYLRAVDDLRRLSLQEPLFCPIPSPTTPRRCLSAASPTASLQTAMARLEDEFRNILISRVNAVEAENLLSDLSATSSLSRSSFSFTGPEDYDEDADAEEDEEPDPSSGDSIAAGGRVAAGKSMGRSTSSTSSSGGRGRRSSSSIRELDLVPPDAAQDLRNIAERMVAAGYSRECSQAYSGVRKAAVDGALRQLGVEKLSIGDVQRLPWDALESKIRRWIRAARVCVRVVFASERRLCDLIFEGLLGDQESNLTPGSFTPSGSDPFVEAVKGAALQLFGFAEAISIGRRSPEKLFKILDLHDALEDLLPDIEAVFSRPGGGGYGSSTASELSIHTQAAEILSRLAEAARGILSEFENAVHLELSKTPVPGGTIHPLTRYVMNYISLISEYKATLARLITSKPSAAGRTSFSGLSDDEPQPPPLPPLPESSFPELEHQAPLAAHLVWVIAILDANLESKCKLYKDASLGHLFVMNNVHYIVQKVKGLPELRELVGDDYLRRLTWKFQQAATNYERAAWVKVLHCLRDEGIHVSGSFSSGVSKSTLRERFKSFNASFDETHRVQSAWSVPDAQLREELRISISEKLLPAYRSFLGRFRHHIESVRHPEMYIKYTVEDLETALVDFFEGPTSLQQSRRRGH